MPKAYDNDLRRKVIEAIELSGMKRCEASEYFGISRNTIHQWFQLKAATGDVKPKPAKRRGHSHKISDWEKFRAFVSVHPDKTRTAMAQLWEGDISDHTISRTLKKIGFTRKKRLMATESEMNMHRADFCKQLATVEAQQIVYADESGTESQSSRLLVYVGLLCGVAHEESFSSASV